METIQKEYFSFLDQKKQETLEEADALIQDGRKDESNILKARANIYDIFKALWNASEKMSTDETEFQKLFMEKATVIPKAWEEALEKAKKFNDICKIPIEEAKLLAASEAKEKFQNLFQD